MCLWLPNLCLQAHLLLPGCSSSGHTTLSWISHCYLQLNVLFSQTYISVALLPILVNDARYYPTRNLGVILNYFHSLTLCLSNQSLNSFFLLFIWCLAMLVYCVLIGIFLILFIGPDSRAYLIFFLLGFRHFIIALKASLFILYNLADYMLYKYLFQPMIYFFCFSKNDFSLEKPLILMSSNILIFIFCGFFCFI